MQVTSSYRVDAPVDWVRAFLIAGAHEEDITVRGDVVEVRQHDRLIDLVVRNTLSADGAATLIDIDAQLRLLGLARVVGGLFHRRVRRTLERGLDRLPVAIAQARGQDTGDEDGGAIMDDDGTADQGGASVSDEQDPGPREHDEAEATTASGASQDSTLEADPRVPGGPRENVAKAAGEASEGEGVVDSAKRVGRELDRTFGGEYEAREDEAAAPDGEDRSTA